MAESPQFRTEGTLKAPLSAQELAQGYSPAFRAVEILSTVLFTLLICRLGWQLISDLLKSGWHRALLPAVGALVGWILADFGSGLVHWGADTWGSVTFPVIGPTLIRSFREHHVDPLAITRHDFFETNGASCLVCLPILAAANLFSVSGASSVKLGFLALLGSLCFWTLMTNQAHQWAHRGRQVPKYVAGLQKLWIVLPNRVHVVHHQLPFMDSYCITTGWLNPLLNKVQLFRHLERAITALTGAIPRAEDLRNAELLRKGPAPISDDGRGA